MMKNMILAAAFVAAALVCAASNVALVTETTATGLTLALDGTGRIVKLDGAGTDCLHATEKSSLISIREYAESKKHPGTWVMMFKTWTPVKMDVVSVENDGKLLRFAFANKDKVFVKLANKGDYLRFEVAETKSENGVAVVNWGPYTTSLHDSAGSWAGIVRSKDYALGILSLGIETDAVDGHAARFGTGEVPAGILNLATIDRTRPVRYQNNQFVSSPVKDVSVVGGAIAMWGVKNPTKDRELDVIEKIVKAEGLPYPTFDGVWAKRSQKANASALWCDYGEHGFDGWVKIAELMGFKRLCRYNCFGNWGHFDPATNSFPKGWASLRACSGKARAHGIGTTTYTLSNFTRAHTVPEKFIAPVLDSRFNTFVDSATTLSTDLPGIEGGAKARPKFDFLWRHDYDLADDVVNNEVRLKKHPEFFKLYSVGEPVVCPKVKEMEGNKNLQRKFINIDGELVCYRWATTNATEVILGGCERGFYGSRIKAHKAGTKVVRVDGYGGYDSLLPGSDDFNDEIARNIAAATVKGGMSGVALDGLERADRAGNDFYSVNRFTKTIYDNLPKDGIMYVSSMMTHYTWHIFSTQSWGEHDWKRGIRGSMFTARVNHQLNFIGNNFPGKLGQYYPEISKVRDIEWIMAFAAAYDAGVDFQIYNQSFPVKYDTDPKMKEKNYPEQLAKIRLWTDAMNAGFFTEKQKMLMRQSDTEWTLSKKDDTFKLDYVGRWTGKDHEVLSPTNVPLASLCERLRIEPCSVNRDWAHAPGQCERWCITDDAVAYVSKKACAFEYASPVQNDRYGKTIPLVVLRATDGDLVNPVIHFKSQKGSAYLRFKTTLKAGEYVTIPHNAALALVYNAEHEMVRDLKVEEFCAFFPCGKGEKIKVLVVSDNTSPVVAKLNLRFIESTVK